LTVKHVPSWRHGKASQASAAGAVVVAVVVVVTVVVPTNHSQSRPT
jgi:hypothetical protein